MKCPFCGNVDTQVVETRMAEDGDFIRRRRQCAACEKRFTTYERPDVNFPSIVKKDGRRIEYERAKLLASMNLALRKRPVSTEQVDGAVERIEEKLLNLGVREVPSTRIGELVMRELKKLDKVAYVRFASVYRSFEDIDEFKTLVSGAGADGDPLDARPADGVEDDLARFATRGREIAHGDGPGLESAAGHPGRSARNERNVLRDGRVPGQPQAVRQSLRTLDEDFAGVAIAIVVGIVKHDPALLPATGTAAGDAVRRLADDHPAVALESLAARQAHRRQESVRGGGELVRVHDARHRRDAEGQKNGGNRHGDQQFDQGKAFCPATRSAQRQAGG
jgi:transcriptional repressor NrdR